VAQKVITKAEAKRNKAEAIKRGEITYDDTPCSKCGNTERYVNSGKCVNCHKERNKRRKSSGKAGKTGKSRAAPALAGAGLVPVTPITDDWQSYADRITATFTATLQKTVEGFIATGALLIEAKAKVDHGDWLKLTERLPFSVRTAQMLMAIAENPVLSNTKHASHLPPHWYTLHLLTKLPEPVLLDKIEDHTINPEMERGDVEVIVAEIEAEAIEVTDAPKSEEVTEAEWPKSSPDDDEVTEAEIIEEAPPSLAELVTCWWTLIIGSCSASGTTPRLRKSTNS
jgi:Protein of unknown function (DUF3102)